MIYCTTRDEYCNYSYPSARPLPAQWGVRGLPGVQDRSDADATLDGTGTLTAGGRRSALRTNLAGRVDRIPLPARHSLLPVFEAVSNSLHAIQATGRQDGHIRVELHRDDAQTRLGLDAERSEPIVEIRVVDNGAGFTDANMAAFDELDTYHKVELGAKGVGRLTWLKVFEKAAVSSVYQAGDGYRHRTFDFVLPN